MLSKVSVFLATLLVASAVLPSVFAQAQEGQMSPFVVQDTPAQEGKDGAQTSDDKVFYLSPGMGYCNVTYRDESQVACLKSYWVDPAVKNFCQRFVKITNANTGITTQAQVLDKCGDVKNSTFGINDIYVSLKTFNKLSGDKAKENKAIGNLQSSVKWEWVVESCEGCATGILARDELHRVDNCTGVDTLGFQRCGRKSGVDRSSTQEAIDKVCNIDYRCPLMANSTLPAS